jgi:small subunit ribosomal protein S2
MAVKKAMEKEEAVEKKELAAEEVEIIEKPEVQEEEDIPDEAKEYIASTEGRKLLTEPETYLKNGTHIGLTYRTGNMRKFIYTIRDDKLSIFSLNSIDERIRKAAKMLARYDKDDILVVGSRAYAKRPVRKFAENAGLKFVSGRFRPGSFTNPQEGNFREPKIVMVADPIADKQAVRESARVGIPMIGVCDSNALTRNLDLIIPLNNKGKQSIALIFRLLTKQYLVERGEMKESDELKDTLEDYISQIQPTKRIETLIKSKKREKFKT